jgi:Fic family protein
MVCGSVAAAALDPLYKSRVRRKPQYFESGIIGHRSNREGAFLFERLDRRLGAIPPESAHRLLRSAARVDSLAGWWDGYVVHPPPGLSRLAGAALAEAADASTRISRSGVQRMPGSGGRGEDVVAAAFRAGCEAALREIAERHRDLPPAERTLLALHDALFSRSPADAHHRGRYKATPPRDGTLRRWGLEPAALRPSSPSIAPGETAFLLSWLSARLAPSCAFHPLAVIGAFLLEFLAIQPFSDGNGRMARLLSTLLLLRSGYAFAAFAPPDRHILGRHGDLLIALRKSQATRNTPKPDITPWLSGYIEVLEASAGELKGRMLAPANPHRLSANQEKALALARRKGEVTNRLLAETLSLPRETAKQTLGRLCELGLLERLGMGRAARYRRPNG